ncbi:carbohydrate ABC transporter permease [Paenibacillus sp. HB172176]|uniref:carbohydrate ABC transporter permease n=1 Tax=Paenibacillus sp. HB172176 TaxID=2493690 RepID=UPI0014389070|nr:carbohydrate ABC transporter permease [Paenibacillus sp. HB172176]
MRNRSASYAVFTVFNYFALAVLAVLCVLPILHMFAVSFSSRAAATANIVNFWPVGWTSEAYTTTLGNDSFLRSLWIAVERTVLGTGVSMLLVIMAAYSLSKTSLKFPGRSTYTWFFVFTMLFNGGLIPTYFLINELHLMDTLWALILPTAVNVWNMILMLNFFRSLPQELEDAALIDGAGHFTVLWRIFFPISMPAVATLSLFAMVFHWNSWFDGVIYMNSKDNYPLASFLHAMVVSNNLRQLGMSAQDVANISNRTVKAAQLFIGTVPILLVYPFLQKYFVKGIVLGSVKE